MLEFLSQWLASAGGIAPVTYWLVDSISHQHGDLVAVDLNGIVVVKRGEKETFTAIPWAAVLKVAADL
jgi:hypothetical protein